MKEGSKKMAQTFPLIIYLLVMNTKADSLRHILTHSFLNLHFSRKIVERII